MDRNLFYINQQSIQLSYDIVENFRKQNFFIGTGKLTHLLQNLNAVAEYIFLQEDCKALAEELQLILPALLDAQDNGDYILQADIIEGDLLPLLQKVQIVFQERGLVQVPDFFEKNMNALKEYNPDFYAAYDRDLLNKNMSDTEKIADRTGLQSREFVPGLAVNGQPTVQAMISGHSIYLHSSVDPGREAKMLIDSIGEADNYSVFGMGLGYHVLEILSRYPTAKVCVYESDIFILQMAFSYVDWTEYIADGRLSIAYDKSLEKLISELSTHFNKMKNAKFLIHYPSIQIVEDEQIRHLLEDFFVTTSSMREQGHLLDENFEALSKLNLTECGELRSLFADKDVVIVGAGPSVESQLDIMRKYRDRITVFATGHIARKLVSNGIIPDAIIITDPQPHMYKQIKDVDLEGVPMILLSTASASIVEYYNGPIYVAYQSGYFQAEEKAKSLGAALFETGGSVTTTALDISLCFGAKRIIFVGVDLAYTGGNSHALGEGRKIENNDGLRQVRSNTGDMVYTSKNLDIYRKWIERRIEGVTGTEIYNTGEGAVIKGTVWKRADEIYEDTIL